MSARGQSPPTVQQKAVKSNCSDIVALAGNVDVKCSSLTPEERQIIANIPAMLNKILAERLDPSAVMSKLNEISAAVKESRLNPPDPNRGLLVPAHDPNPPTDAWCESHASADMFRLYLGSSVIISSGFPVGGIQAHGKSVLSFSEHDGKVAVSASISSPDGKRIVFMRDNYFKLDDYFRKESPDASTLNVFDETHDEPVLHVRYLNPKAILVTGRFSAGSDTLNVTEHSVTMSPLGVSTSGDCTILPPNDFFGFVF